MDPQLIRLYTLMLKHKGTVKSCIRMRNAYSNEYYTIEIESPNTLWPTYYKGPMDYKVYLGTEKSYYYKTAHGIKAVPGAGLEVP